MSILFAEAKTQHFSWSLLYRLYLVSVSRPLSMRLRRAARLFSSSTFSSSSTIRYFGRSLKRSSKRPALERLLPSTSLLLGSLDSSSSISVLAEAMLPWRRQWTGLSEVMLLIIMSFLSSWPMMMSKRSGGISAVSSCGVAIPW